MNPLAEALKAAFSRATKTDEGFVLRSTRGDLPFRIDLRSIGTVEHRSKQVQGDIVVRAEGMPGPEIETSETCDDVLVTGTASSTSVDWYGTEMSEKCLQGMADQFSRGVGVFPSHGGGLFGPGLEWDDEMGKTTGGEVSRAQVVEPFDATEPGWALKVLMALDGGMEKVCELARRLAKGQPIGLSIGGWFREVRYIEDERGREYDRIIVEEVELDHLAIVRAPACPDCQDLELLSKAGAEWKRGEPTPAMPEETPEETPKDEAEPASEPSAEVEPRGGDVEAEMAAPETSNPTGVSTSQGLDSISINSENRDVADEAVPTQENESMTPEERALFDSLKAEVNAIKAARSTPEPAVETAEARAIRLEGELARSRQVIANLTSQPQRVGRGLGMVSASGQVSEVDAMINRAKGTGKHEALVGVVERSKKILSVGFRARGEEVRTKLAEARDEAPDFLRDVCEAAHADGTLSEWYSTARNETLVG